MYVKSITASNLRENLKECLESIKDREAVQILHKSGLKIIISQGYFLEMVAKLAAYEGIPNKTATGPSLDSFEKYMAEGMRRADERSKMLEAEEAQNGEGLSNRRLGRERRKAAR